MIIGHEAVTSGLSAQTGVFIGSQAGRNISSAVGAIMIGFGAGANATNSNSSVIIGNYAGYGSTNSANSVLIGNRAGYSLDRSYSLVIEAHASYSDAGNTGLIYGEFDNRVLKFNATSMGFFGITPAAKPTVSGSRGSNAALASLLTGLAALGLVTDSSS